MIPKYVFFTKGVGVHRNRLESFELALRGGNIQMLNLVEVSSILPPNARIISKEEGMTMLQPGQVTFTVMSRNTTDEPRRLITASVGIARPKDRSRYGYISEHHDFGLSEHEASDRTEDMAASMLASTLGLPFNPDAAWDERKEVFKMSHLLVETFSVSQEAYGFYEENMTTRKFTTVIAAAVMVLEP